MLLTSEIFLALLKKFQVSLKIWDFEGWPKIGSSMRDILHFLIILGKKIYQKKQNIKLKIWTFLMVFAENDPKGPKIDQNGPHHIFLYFSLEGLSLLSSDLKWF